uniref:RNase H domain-containing protein n=1 Tax=Strongyloides papillosus TaxID=174720 RepID=A0A0N5BL29_STREA
MVMEYFVDNGIYPAYSIPRHSQSNGSAESKEVKTINENVLNAVMVFINGRTMEDKENGTLTTPAEKFFNIKLLMEKILDKYQYNPEPLKCNCWVKIDKKSKWIKGVALERISKSVYKVQVDNKIYVRKDDMVRLVNDNLIVQPEDSEESDSLRSSLVCEDIADEMFSLTLEARDMQQQINEYLGGTGNRSTLVKNIENNKVVQEFIVVPEKFCVELEVDYQKCVKKLDNVLVISSDGSCEKERGYGVGVYRDNRCVHEHSGRLGNNSSAQLCEMFAFAKGLELAFYHLKPDEIVVMVSDSCYVCNLFSEQICAIRKADYMKSSGKTLVHRELIRKADEMINKLENLYIIQDKRHAGIRVNEKADELAKKGAKLNPKFVEKI